MNILTWLINGLRIGSIYALVALGYNMVYGIVKLINFAHGDIIMIGAYTAWVFLSMSGVPFWISALAAIVMCIIFGVVIERLAYKPLRQAPRISLLITALAVSIFLQNLCLYIPGFGASPKGFAISSPVSPIKVGAATIDFFTILTIIISLVTMYLLNMLVKNTRMGKAMRAVSEDSGAARLMGINVNSTISFTFAIGSGLAGLASVFYSLYAGQISPTMGSMPGLKAFVAAVLGGIGSIPGAMIGGFVLGIAESVARGVASSWSDAVVFAILIIVLLVKPAGLMGKKMNEKV